MLILRFASFGQMCNFVLAIPLFINEKVHIDSDGIIPTSAYLCILPPWNPISGREVTRLCTVESLIEARVIRTWEIDDEFPRILGHLDDRNLVLLEDLRGYHKLFVTEELGAFPEKIWHYVSHDSLEPLLVRHGHTVP